MKKTLVCSFCFLFLFFGSASGAALAADAAVPRELVSPGLCVLAEEGAMAMAGIRGESIRFSKEDFARAMNLPDVRHITVTEIPPITDGTLTVGTTVVNAGQTISADSLNLLSYTAKSAVTTSSFRFCVEDSPVEMRCQLYLLEQQNYAPTLSVAPQTAMEVSTHCNITLHGTLPSYDPEGDPVTVEIVSYPEQGLLHLTDRTTGAYTYTPGKNYTGSDSFTYVARDLYGNYSASRTVSLTVQKRATSVVYADMTDSPAYNAALTMTEEGIMCGTQVGATYLFEPSRSVTRSEFLVMAMHAAGIREVANVSPTVFADASDIPEAHRGFVATAYQMGYIKGAPTEDGLCFLPNQPITRAEAAWILSNIMDPAVPTFSPTLDDAHDIPSYADTAVHTLCAIGVMSANDGKISPTESLNRADAAQMLCAMMQLSE